MINQSINATNDPGCDQPANDIWTMLGASPAQESDGDKQRNQTNSVEQNEIYAPPDLASEILSKLDQRKKRAAAHLGISSAEVETMPFDLTALEQAGIFLNIDATGFSVLSRQLDWQSLGIELPKELAVHLSPPLTELLFDNCRKPLQRAASGTHGALDRYQFSFRAL